MTISIWDQHTALALSETATVEELARYRVERGAVLSVNVGYAPQTYGDVLALLAHYRSGVESHSDLALAGSVDDIDRITGSDRIAVIFDLEDARPLDGDLNNLSALYQRGVRTVVPTYNHSNGAGHGCLDRIDGGLTPWGRDLIRELNRVGMVPDASHCSRRTGLEMCTVSNLPVVYSHSCMAGLWEHPRNISDDQARACADTGGVIGITGVGIFLGPNTPSLDALALHLEYAIDLVGVEHVGVSSDYSFDSTEFLSEISLSPELFDASYTRWGPIQWMAPETFVKLGAHLHDRGWRQEDIAAVLWQNFYRVARRTWRASE